MEDMTYQAAHKMTMITATIDAIDAMIMTKRRISLWRVVRRLDAEDDNFAMRPLCMMDLLAFN